MPPKVKITKEQIIQAGVEIVRWEGEPGVNARNIAAYLGCSTQPIFSNFSSMEELWLAVIGAAAEIYSQYIGQVVASSMYPAYKASGMGYIRFAKEEKNLFRLLFMRNRGNKETAHEAQLFDQMGSMVQDMTGLENDRARLFHLEMWTFVHGIATMMATGYLELDMDLVSVMMSDVYLGIKHRFEKE